MLQRAVRSRRSRSRCPLRSRHARRPDGLRASRRTRDARRRLRLLSAASRTASRAPAGGDSSPSPCRLRRLARLERRRSRGRRQGTVAVARRRVRAAREAVRDERSLEAIDDRRDRRAVAVVVARPVSVSCVRAERRDDAALTERLARRVSSRVSGTPCRGSGCGESSSSQSGVLLAVAVATCHARRPRAGSTPAPLLALVEVEGARVLKIAAVRRPLAAVDRVARCPRAARRGGGDRARGDGRRGSCADRCRSGRSLAGSSPRSCASSRSVPPASREELVRHAADDGEVDEACDARPPRQVAESRRLLGAEGAPRRAGSCTRGRCRRSCARRSCSSRGRGTFGFVNAST